MRTRSRASVETVDQASEKKGAAKRKRTNHDPAVGYAESTIKRSRTQSCALASSASRSRASRAKSPFKEKGHNSTDPELPAEGSSDSSTFKNGEDEAFAMTLGKFAGAIRKQGAADKSPQKPTVEKSCASPKKPITKKQDTQVRSVFIRTGHSSDDTHILNDSHGRDDNNSTDGGAAKGSRDDITPTQGVLVERCSSGSGRNVHTPGTCTHYGQDGLQIRDSPLSPQEVTCTQCQSHEDGHHNVADADGTLVKSADAAATFVNEETETWLHHKKKRSFLGGRRTTSSKRRLEEWPFSCPRPGNSEGCPGYMKRFKNQRKHSNGTMLPEIPQRVNFSFSHRRQNAAKSRWKNLIQSILRTQIFPERLASASENSLKHQVFSRENVPGNDHSHRLTDIAGVNKQTRFIAKSKRNKTLSQPKKQRKPSAVPNTSTGRLQQKVRNQQLSLLKRMKAWLAEAKFSQGPREKTSNDSGEEFMMTEDERCAFARSMVQSCQKNPNMRIAFLESVRRLTSSGLMQAAASNLLLQGPCDEAQAVMDAWAKFKEQNAITKTLPMNLLSAVNQLHEKRGDLLTKLGTPNTAGICVMSQIDEKTWKFQLPGSHLENSLIPRNMGQETTL